MRNTAPAKTDNEADCWVAGMLRYGPESRVQGAEVQGNPVFQEKKNFFTYQMFL